MVKNNPILIKKLDKIQKLINDTGEFDLDKRQMGILILNALSECQK